MLTTLRAAMRRTHAAAALSGLALLAACGGGGGGGSNQTTQSCSPNNPFRADATGPTVPASLTVEKSWVRGYFDTSYLWYNEVPNVNPADPAYSVDTLGGFYSSIDNYFRALKSVTLTASGAKRDQFSFTYPTKAWDQLINSGSTVGYGIEWHITQPSGAPRVIRVAYVHAGSQAAAAGILRGDTLMLADGVAADDNTTGGVNALSAALFPAPATPHSFSFSRTGVPNSDYTFVAGDVLLEPVRSQVLNVGGAKVGYLSFTDHVLTAEGKLITAFQGMQTAGVSDLVLDLRYNGGGYLYIASQVAYMIGGATTSGRVFESIVFNNKRSSQNSSSGFVNTACLPDVNFDCTAPSSAALPTLNLSKVYVLTSPSTCSASEAIINGLRGVGIDVRQIGTHTCGKPYGFYGQSNCGITYFPIEFKGVNAVGFGDYSDGFFPDATGNTADLIKGCTVGDDLDRALGDPAEGQLATALYHRENGGTCPPVPLARQSPLSVAPSPAMAGKVLKAEARNNGYGHMPAR